MTQAKPNILVVDDEDSMLKTYKFILNSAYEPVLSNNATEALELLKTKDFPLVLLDMKMPDMSGTEALKKIKEIDKNIDVIIVTAQADIKPSELTSKLGAFDCIKKPFEVDALLAAIEKVFDKGAR